MENILQYMGLLSFFVSAAVLAVALMILKSSKKPAGDEALHIKVEQLAKNLPDEFQRSRNDAVVFQNNLQQTVDQKLNETAVKLNDLKTGNLKHQMDIMTLLNNSLDKIWKENTQQNEKQSQLIEKSIRGMQESNEKKLEEMRATVDEKLSKTLNERLDSSFKTVSEQLDRLYKSLGEMKELSTGVTDNVTALNRVLTNVKARGTWAEVQLESILDQTIPNMYEKNYTPPGMRAQVEFAIKIPASGDSSQMTYLPVDSKFPMEDYIRLCEAADSANAELLAQSRAALERRVEEEAKNVSKYISVPHTTPFAIMYLATEGLYAEIASSKAGLPEKLQSKYNIMIAGPTTITALLNSLAMGYRSVAINEKANEIRTLLGAIKSQYEKFGAQLDKVRKNIDSASKNLEDAEHRNTLIYKKLKTVEALDTDTAEAMLTE